VGQVPVAELLDSWRDGRIKLRVTHDLLRFRRANPALFDFGEYRPQSAVGSYADRIVAFERRQKGLTVLVVIPRLTAKLGAPPLGAVWDDTRLEGNAIAASWTDIVSGATHEGNGALMVRELFSELPFAVLVAGRAAQ
jgi:maltooligosyltrehalose synthase